MEQVILDVREQDEFAAERVPGSIWVPLSNFGHTAPGVLQSLVGKKILIMCRSGNRARLALAQITQLGFGGQVKAEVFEGGIIEWARQGKPVTIGKGSRLPLMRQVQVAAGLIVFSSVVLGFASDQRFFWLAGFVGAGLTFAGFTGFCGLAKLLALMPWNKSRPAQDCICG